jgi:hypothetical protein
MTTMTRIKLVGSESPKPFGTLPDGWGNPGLLGSAWCNHVSPRDRAMVPSDIVTLWRHQSNSHTKDAAFHDRQAADWRSRMGQHTTAAPAEANERAAAECRLKSAYCGLAARMMQDFLAGAPDLSDNRLLWEIDEIKSRAEAEILSSMD